MGSSLYSVLPQTEEMKVAKAAMELQSEVLFRYFIEVKVNIESIIRNVVKVYKTLQSKQTSTQKWSKCT